jgi:para-nitrobenzyl esterase
MRALLLSTIPLAVACGGTTSVPTADAGASADAADAARDAQGDGGAVCAAPSSDPLVVATERGLLRGASDQQALRWLGVPFAEPPVGALRWRPPVRASGCWTGVREATEWAQSCPQIPQRQGQPFDPMAAMLGQEDCLTLNVWRPAEAPADAALPVMFFIHGGGNVVGSAGETTPAGLRSFDGARLASRGGVVVVVAQYRLGPLGFLMHPALEAESGAEVGDLGTLDQITALRWVQRNIRAFRGDPTRVMIFGESAGAVNVCTLLASPAAAGLFSRALMQSGVCSSQRSAEASRATAARFAEAAGCAAAADVPACMRALSADAVVRALPAPVSISGLDPAMVNWGPVFGTPVLPERPLDAIAAGRHNRVPFVVGHNTEEVGLTVPAIANEAAYRAALVAVGGAQFADRVMAVYPVSAYPTARAALVQALTDARFGCGARSSARAAVAGGAGATVYRYLFAQPLESAGVTLRALGAWHGVELGFLFQNLSAGALQLTANELAVERAMLAYWTRFAATGDPNGAGDPPWPAYTAGEPLLRIAPASTTVNGWRSVECDAWDLASGTTIPAP